MTSEQQPEVSPTMQHALDELKGIVERRYPEATFHVAQGQDEPDSIHLIAAANFDDPDEVVDLVIDRVLELQLDQGLPVHVIPIRPLPRVLEDQASQRKQPRPRIDWGAATRQP